MMTKRLLGIQFSTKLILHCLNTQVTKITPPNFELADIVVTNDPNDIPNDTNTSASLTCATAGVGTMLVFKLLATS